MPEYPGERTIPGLVTVGVGGLFPDYFDFWRLEYLVGTIVTRGK